MKSNVLIIGAGMAGNGAAYHLAQQGVRAKMVDKNKHYGGQTASFAFEEKYVFDNGPHLSFTSDERIRDLFADSVDQSFETIANRVNNYWQGRWVKHPAIVHMNALPAELVTQCLLDFVKVQERQPYPDPENYAQWLIGTYGETFAKTFPMQYGKRYHTCPAEKMSLSWLGSRLYKPNMQEVFYGALSSDAPNVHYVQNVRYPSHGGYVSYLNKFKNLAEVHLDEEVVQIDSVNKEVTYKDGRKERYSQLISSMPLPEIIRILTNVPIKVQKAADLLCASICMLVNIVIDRADISEDHWTYFYDEDFSFTRLSFPHMQSPHNVPPGCGSFQAELYFSNKYRPVDRTHQQAILDTKKDLIRCGLLKETDKILFENAWTLPYANIIFDLDEAESSAIVKNYLKEIGIWTCGRYGDWGYIWTDQSFKSGEVAAQRALDSI